MLVITEKGRVMFIIFFLSRRILFMIKGPVDNELNLWNSNQLGMV